MDDPDFGKVPGLPTPFGDRLSALCAFELSDAHGDPDRIGAMIERLINAVSFTIAIAGRGDPATIDKMLQGAEGYLFQAATDHKKIGSFMATAGKRAQRSSDPTQGRREE